MNSLREFLARRLTTDRLRFYATAVIAVSLLLMIVSIVGSKNGQTAFGTRLGGDFPAFYIAGKIAIERGVEFAYDTDLHFTSYHQMFPKEPAAEALPYVNPPFLLPLFSMLAQLPYQAALGLWLLLSAAMYLVALRLILAHCQRLPQGVHSLAILLSLSFAPFVVYCWAWGQLAALGACFMALAIYLEKIQKQFWSGCALALCAYKPTLLLAVVPMLLFTKRFRSLAGVATGAAVLGAASWALVGWQGLVRYIALLAAFNRSKSAGIFPTWLYVDLRSFAPAVPAVILVVALSAALVYVWLKVGDRSLVWAITITVSLLANVYTPIYDCALLAVPVLLMANRCYVLGAIALQLKILVAVLWLLPWASQSVAQATGVQLYTVAIAAFTVWLFAQSKVPAAIPQQAVEASPRHNHAFARADGICS